MTIFIILGNITVIALLWNLTAYSANAPHSERPTDWGSAAEHGTQPRVVYVGTRISDDGLIDSARTVALTPSRSKIGH